MRIGVIFAMREELDAFLALYENPKKQAHANMESYEITQGEHTIFIAKSGIGKVQAAAITTLFIKTYDLDCLLSSGIAGGYNTHIGSLVLGVQYIQHDVDLSAFGYPKTQIPEMPKSFKPDEHLITTFRQHMPKGTYQEGVIATGDQFITTIDHLDDVFKLYPNIKAFEMESGAIAQVAHVFKLPYLALRTISDVVATDDQFDHYQKTIKTTFDKNAQYLKTFFEALMHEAR